MEGMIRSVHWLADLAAQYGLIALLVLAGLLYFLEGVGLPLPVEIPLIMAARLVIAGEIHLGGAIALAFFCTVAGNGLGYLIGRIGGRPLVYEVARRFHVREETLVKAEDWFARHGLKLVLGTRWINWGFAQNIWLSGMSRMPFLRFFIPIVINDMLWAVVYTWLWVRFFSLIRAAFHRYEAEVLVVLLALAAVGGLVWLVRRRGRQRREQEAPELPPG